jgi:hypothetical protein
MPSADRLLFVLVAARAGVVQPERRDHQDVGRGAVESSADARITPACDKPRITVVRLFVGALEDAREAQAQAPVAAEDVDQVAVEEAVIPDALEHQVQLQPDVFQVGQAAFGRASADRCALRSAEEVLDDVVLVAEVVVQVARADLQLVGDVVGGDVGLALRVEHRERRIEDALSGLPGHGRSRASGRQLS